MTSQTKELGQICVSNIQILYEVVKQRFWTGLVEILSLNLWLFLAHFHEMKISAPKYIAI